MEEEIIMRRKKENKKSMTERRSREGERIIKFYILSLTSERFLVSLQFENYRLNFIKKQIFADLFINLRKSAKF